MIIIIIVNEHRNREKNAQGHQGVGALITA